MKKLFYSILAIFLYSCSQYADNAESYHNFFFRDAGDITTGVFNNNRIDSSSVTKQGNLLLFYDGYLHFMDGSLQTTAAGSSQWVTNGAKIYSVNTGNVGIGTTSPGAKLEILGSLTSTSTTKLASAEGNVGIGTTGTPSSMLDIFGGSITVRGTNAGLQIGPTIQIDGTGVRFGTTTNMGAVTMNQPAGATGPQLVVSTGTTRIFEVTSSSVQINVNAGNFFVNGSSLPSQFPHAVYNSSTSATVYSVGFTTITKQTTGVFRATFAKSWISADSYSCWINPRTQSGIKAYSGATDDAFAKSATQIQFRIVNIVGPAENDVGYIEIGCVGD